jgi:hypothetical protein
MICSESEHWSSCAQKVKQAIANAGSAEDALAAGNEWARQYRRLYDQSARTEWTASDQQRLEDGMSRLFDETVGEYLDPAALALSLALSRYFPTLAAVIGLASKPVVQAFYVLLAPSPIANDFTEATPANEEINLLIGKRLDLLLGPGWRGGYTRMFQQSYQDVKGRPINP